MKLILFDVCWTLTSVNSTDEYISFLQERGIRPWMKIFSTKFAHRIYGVLNYIFKVDSHRFLNALYFRRLDPRALSRYHDQFWEKYSSSFIPEIFEQYLQFIDDVNSEVHLISGSFDMPIRILAERTGVTFSATELEKMGSNSYSWRIAMDILWKKMVALYNHDLGTYSEVILYTDNLSDWNLIEWLDSKCDDFFARIVVYENKSNWDEFFEKNSQIKHEYFYANT